MPPLHRWPDAHAGLLPQTQEPSSAQPFARVGLHDAHTSPGGAQLVTERVAQTLPAQHPVGQEVASQTHAPPTQRWPAPHAAPPPQVQPPAMQPSALLGSQDTHAPPPAPHVVGEAVWHVEPVQHPSGQVVALQPAQAPVALQPPPPQSSQVEPPLPQNASSSPARQVVPSQQPAHESPSQTQAPPSQRWPVAQAGPLPHAQLPPAPQPSEVSASQVVQLPPGSPQVDGPIVRQSSPSQQPLVQLAGVQRQTPESHV